MSNYKLSFYRCLSISIASFSPYTRILRSSFLKHSSWVHIESYFGHILNYQDCSNIGCNQSQERNGLRAQRRFREALPCYLYNYTLILHSFLVQLRFYISLLFFPQLYNCTLIINFELLLRFYIILLHP